MLTPLCAEEEHKRAGIECGRSIVSMGEYGSDSACTFPSPLHFLRWTLLFVILVFLIHAALNIHAIGRIFSSYDPSPTKYSNFSLWERLLPSDAAAGNCGLLLEDARSRLRDSVVFLPLKDVAPAVNGETNIIRAINATFDGEQAQHVRFPSPDTGGRLLCLAGNHSGNGTKNSYALAWPDALPRGAAFLLGLTFVSENFYDYKNLWHGLEAVVPFVAWHGGNGCRRPARWVLYKKGELQSEISPWIKGVAEASMGDVRIERLGRPSCFEEAVLFRHNEGRMSPKTKMRAFDTIRCKARALCNVTDSAAGESLALVRLTLFLRTGARAFKNESAVIDVFRRACAAAGDCRLTVAWAAKIESFCEQVTLMSRTDVLATPHGAQLSNMIFMDKNSSVMEFFPSGWKEAAGTGQFVYHSLAAKSGMRHPGVWRDTHGVACDSPEDLRRCFSLFYKNQQLGHDEDQFFNWTVAVIAQARETKLHPATAVASSDTCGCE